MLCYAVGDRLLADPHASWQQGFKKDLQYPALTALACEMADWCAARGVALRTLALKFAVSHPAVTSTPIGCRSPKEVDEVVDSMLQDTPPALLDDFQATFDARVAALGREHHWFYNKASSNI